MRLLGYSLRDHNLYIRLIPIVAAAILGATLGILFEAIEDRITVLVLAFLAMLAGISSTCSP